MSRRSLGSIAAAVFGLLIVAVFTLSNFITGQPGTPLPPTGPTSLPGEAWYRLYFTDPTATAGLASPTGGVPAAILASLAEAQQTIDVAVYDFDLQPLADGLIAAHQRGVRVRVVTDSDYLAEAAMQSLRQAGLPVRGDDRDAFMHHKFVVIDEASVWMGSMNFTFNDAYRNNNSMLHLFSTRLAQNYTAKFEQMFVAGDFGRTLVAPSPTLTLSGTLVENYFSPDGGVAAKVLDVLTTAATSIRFMAFSFTREDFAAALVEKARAGVTVQGVFETRQLAAGADGAWTTLSAAGLEVRRDGNPYTLHSKVFIVDEQIVVVGSYNFSRNAEEQNDENILILHSPAIAAAYLAEWQRVWQIATP